MKKFLIVLTSLAITLIAFSTPAIHEPLVKEGRTWWYHTFTPIYFEEDNELGLRIGKKVNLDGKEWNEVSVIKRATYDKNTKVEKYFNTDSCLVAYLREETGRVYSRFSTDPEASNFLKGIGGNNRYGIIGYCDFPGDMTVLDYNLKAGDLFKSGIENEYVNIYIDSISYITNSGNEFKCYNGRIIESNSKHATYDGEPFKFIDRIGFITSEPDDMISELFYAPLGCQIMSTIQTFGPWLRYVTEGDENSIIYTGMGGMKLWETQSGVNDITIESNATSPQWFNLQGHPIEKPTTPGIYIRLDGKSATKVVVK